METSLESDYRTVVAFTSTVLYLMVGVVHVHVPSPIRLRYVVGVLDQTGARASARGMLPAAEIMGSPPSGCM